MPLHMTRKEGESIQIGEAVLTVTETRATRVVFTIDAPLSVRIDRLSAGESVPVRVAPPCPLCGEDATALIIRKGHPDTFRCDPCGHHWRETPT